MYRYWVLLHIVGVVGLMVSHGVSMFAVYRIRNVGLDRDRITEIISFSNVTVIPMYVSLGVLLVGGVAAAIMGHYLSDTWILLSIAILVLIDRGDAGHGRPLLPQDHGGV